MNTNHARRATLAFLLAALAAATAQAGEGLQYWTTLPTNAAALAESKSPAVTPPCPGSRVVAVTAMKSTWSNGRGPLTAVQAGTERICTVCPVTTMTNRGWSNGRGPVAKSEVPTTGSAHTCTGHCAPKA